MNVKREKAEFGAMGCCYRIETNFILLGNKRLVIEYTRFIQLMQLSLGQFLLVSFFLSSKSIFSSRSSVIFVSQS